MKKIKVTLQRSLIGRLKSHKACIRGLGLRKLGSSSELVATPQVLGMIKTVRYLVEEREL